MGPYGRIQILLHSWFLGATVHRERTNTSIWIRIGPIAMNLIIPRLRSEKALRLEGNEYTES